MIGVEADRERCVGSGTCEMLAPGVFEVGEDGVVVLLRGRPADDDVQAMRDAVQQCPTRALTLTD